MQLSKNKKYQYTFFLIILNYSIFNGGNSNLLIQVNFLLISFFYIFCLIDKNYNQHLKYFVKENKRSIFFYVLFLLRKWMLSGAPTSLLEKIQSVETGLQDIENQLLGTTVSVYLAKENEGQKQKGYHNMTDCDGRINLASNEYSKVLDLK